MKTIDEVIRAWEAYQQWQAQQKQQANQIDSDQNDNWSWLETQLRKLLTGEYYRSF